jgi:hypothetical protein
VGTPLLPANIRSEITGSTHNSGKSGRELSIDKIVKQLTRRATMPYIARENRGKYADAIDDILNSLPESSAEAAGEFTYVIYRLLERFNGRYWERALGTGSVVMAILELYRRSHAPYEDVKLAEHGDV